MGGDHTMLDALPSTRAGTRSARRRRSPADSMEHQSQSDRARNEPPHAAYLASLVDAALEAHHANRLDAAESLYREALVLDPVHTGALHYSGGVQYQPGNHDAAASLMSRALKLDRHDAACWSNRRL